MDVENALNDVKPVGDELCRLCANTDKQFIPIFQAEGMEHNICEQIKKYLPIITVTKVDKLPLQICYQCTSTLLGWHNFFEQCRVADNRLREILSVNAEFNKDDESCHDYTDDFHDDFDDQPSISDRVCDNTREKSVHFELPVHEVMDNSDDVDKDTSKPVTENADSNRCLRMTAESTDKKCAFAKMLGLKRKRRCSSRHSKSTVPQLEDAVAPTDNKSLANERPSGICPCLWSTSNACSECTPCDQFECACCPKVFPDLRLRNRHLRSQHRDRLFDYCFNWLYENSLKSSIAEAPPEATITTFSCHDCADTFTDKNTLIRHLRAHHKNEQTVRNSQVLLCDLCGVSSPTKAALIAHLRSAHPRIYSGSADRGAAAPDADPIADYYTCDICGHAFLKLQALTRHLNLHSAGEFACSKCERCFASEAERDAHDLQRHKGLAKNVFVVNGRKYLRCDQCPFTCRNERTKLEDHRRVHTGEKPFTCETCGKQFRTRTLLGVHQRYVHDGVKKFACDLCGRRFSSRRYMQDHRRIHTGERPLICHLCGNSFRQSSSLMKHLEHHAGVKRHACHLCDKRFTNAHRLRVHIKRHLGVTTHVCADCGKGFVDGGQLKDHCAVHSDARPHVCPQCGAAFKLRKHLRQHGRTHKFVS